MHVEYRDIVSSDVVERYLTATPDLTADPDQEAALMFAAIRQEATRCGGRICRQRVFVPEGNLEAYLAAWEAITAGEQPDCPGNWLNAGPGAAGGVQAHVLAGALDWRPLRDDAGRRAGWVLRNGRVRWAVVDGLHLARTGDDERSTRAALATAERLIAQADMELSDIARTWFFLHDILGWYGRFNEGRNHVFRERGLLGSPGREGVHVPASTGIGAAPAYGSRLAMELIAVAGVEGAIVRRLEAGRQRCAYQYGSAFARASEAVTPAGRTVFVSGTAAIDREGRTCCVGDAKGQIRMTLQNVLAVLSDAGCRPTDAVQATAYCRTPAVADLFADAFKNTLPWPWVTVVCDICRNDLLFEAEVTAGLPADAGFEARRSAGACCGTPFRPPDLPCDHQTMETR